MTNQDTHSSLFSSQSTMPLLHELANLLMIIRLGCEKLKCPTETEVERQRGVRQIELACDEMAQLMRLESEPERTGSGSGSLMM